MNSRPQLPPRDDYEPPIEDEGGLTAQIEALKRRKWPMLAVFLTIVAAAAAAALLWPATYRSAGTILIEQQEVPSDFIRSAVSSFADERVQVISQRVMTGNNLMGIIDKYKLYPKDRDDFTREQLIQQMREDVKLEMISADVVDPRQGRATKATIAFSLGYESQSPEQATRVANDLVTLFLRENIETRKQQAASTTSFLAEESERIRASVTALEQKLSEFKEANYDQLPEFSGMNAQLVSSTQQELRDVESRISALDQQANFLQAQLAQIEPRMPAINQEGQILLGGAERLRMLREQYVASLATYTPKHPAVASVKRDLYSAELQTGGGSAALAVLGQIETATEQLVTARNADALDQPTIQALEAKLASLTRQLKDMPVRGPSTAAGVANADNPAYLQIKAQAQTLITERNVLAMRRGQLQGQLANLQLRQARAPAVERDYGAMQRELQGEQMKYAEVRQKQMEAQLAQNLESEQKGERFTLIDPPVMPQEPVKPNRPAIFVLGFVLASAAAVGLMLLLELLDTRIRGRRQVVKELGEPPLAIIPWVGEEPKPYEPELRKRLWKKLRGQRMHDDPRGGRRLPAAA
jgi:uncharacterized protein involved in exopolysaccharide biosynthesis